MSPARFAASLMFFANGCAFATWASRIPAVQQSFELSPSAIGIALLMMGLGAITAMQFVARLISRFGSNKVTAVTCLIAGACIFGISLTNNLYQLCAALFLFGLFSGGMDVAMNANAVTVEELEKKPIMASFHALWSIGSMVGALVGGALAHAGWSLNLHFSVVACVVTIFAGIAMRWLVGERERSTEQKNPAAIAKNKTIFILAIVCLLAFVSEGAIADWSALYMVRGLHTDAGLGSMGLAAFSAAMTIGRLFGDKFIERFGDVAVLTTGSIITFGAILLATIPQMWICALLGFFLSGLGLSIQVPIAFRVSGRSQPENPGAAIASVARAGYLGLLLGPPVLGFIADAAGLRFSILGLSSLAVLTLICSTRLNKNIVRSTI